MEWIEYSLSEIISHVIDYRGKTPKKLGGDWGTSGYRALSAKNIKTGKIVQHESIRYIDKNLYGKWMKEEIKRGDILITSEAPFGEIYLWATDEKIVLSQRLFAIRCKNGFDPKFIYLYMTTPYFQGELLSRATGTTVIGLRQPELLKCKIYAPNYNNQCKISAVLGCLEDKITLNEKINDYLEQTAQAIFKNWFVDFGPTKYFTDIVQIFGGGTPKTGVAQYWNGSIPFFTPKDALATYVLSTEKFLSESGLINCNSRLYSSNTVFVTARGTVGKLALAGCPMAMNQSCYALIGNDGYGQYFIYHLASEIIERLKYKASGAVFDAIVTRDFERERIPAPTVEEARKFETMITPIYEEILNNSKENAHLASLRDTLLPRLMSGELSVADIQAAK